MLCCADGNHQLRRLCTLHAIIRRRIARKVVYMRLEI
jgi:hypothetical protein